MSPAGRTTYVPKDAAWWRRSRIVELGHEHGPAGPAVIDWLTCEARAQGPIRGHDGSVKAGYAAVAHGCFLPGGAAEAKAITATAVEVGLLDDFTEDRRTFTCRISGWKQDVDDPIEAARKARQRDAKVTGDTGEPQGTPHGSEGTTGDNGGQPGVREGEGEVEGEKETTDASHPVEPDRLDAARDRLQTVQRVFDYWQQQTDHPQAKLTRDRRAKIEARLRDGYTEQQILGGIDGAARAAFVNDQGKRFDDLELICRSGSKLEGFIERAIPSNGGALVPSFGGRSGDGFAEALIAAGERLDREAGAA